MFISREEITQRKEEAKERVKPIIGETYIYYHVVGKPDNPKVDYGICGSEVVIAGFRYSEEENLPYEVDIAIPTQTEDLFVLMSNVKVESAYAVLEGKQHAVFVEHEHSELIAKIIGEQAKGRQVSGMPAIRRGAHLSLVVDNENTVGALLNTKLGAVKSIEEEMSADDIIDLLKDNIIKQWMPLSRLNRHWQTCSVEYLKAADDGDFMRLMLESEKTALFKRDALRSEEVWAVLPMENYNIVVGLKSLQVFMGARGGKRAYGWVSPSKVNSILLAEAVGAL
jgi:hypothetical protein